MELGPVQAGLPETALSAANAPPASLTKPEIAALLQEINATDVATLLNVAPGDLEKLAQILQRPAETDRALEQTPQQMTNTAKAEAEVQLGLAEKTIQQASAPQTGSAPAARLEIAPQTVVQIGRLLLEAGGYPNFVAASELAAFIPKSILPAAPDQPVVNRPVTQTVTQTADQISTPQTRAADPVTKTLTVTLPQVKDVTPAFPAVTKAAQQNAEVRLGEAEQVIRQFEKLIQQPLPQPGQPVGQTPTRQVSQPGGQQVGQTSNQTQAQPPGQPVGQTPAQQPMGQVPQSQVLKPQEQQPGQQMVQTAGQQLSQPPVQQRAAPLPAPQLALTPNAPQANTPAPQMARLEIEPKTLLQIGRQLYDTGGYENFVRAAELGTTIQRTVTAADQDPADSKESPDSDSMRPALFQLSQAVQDPPNIKSAIDYKQVQSTAVARLDAEVKLDLASRAVEQAGGEKMPQWSTPPQTLLQIGHRLYDTGGYTNYVRAADLADTIQSAYWGASLIVEPTAAPGTPMRVTKGPTLPRVAGSPSVWGKLWNVSREKAPERVRSLWRRAPLLVLFLGWLAIGIFGGVLFSGFGFEFWALGFLAMVGLGFYATIRK